MYLENTRFRRFFCATAAKLCVVVALASVAMPALLVAQEQPGLSPASSAELQRLLRVQNKEIPTRFANTTPPRIPTGCLRSALSCGTRSRWTRPRLTTPLCNWGRNRLFGEQFGPARSSRAMAIIHIAMFEAVNAVTQRYQTYTGLANGERPGVDQLCDCAIGARRAYLFVSFPVRTAGRFAGRRRKQHP